MFSKSNLVILVCVLAGTAVLSGLGLWQLNRMSWKEALIERVNARVTSDKVQVLNLATSGFSKDEQEYQPVLAKGTFDHSKEVYFFGTAKGGASGWLVHTPLQLETGQTLIVNRGFVPFDRKAPGTRPQGQIEGVVQLSGLLRFPLTEKPFGSVENDLEAREFFWRNTPEMAAAMGITTNVLPVIVDADESENPGGLPLGGTTILAFSNNHLQYVITWFGLALTLIGVGGYFLFTRRQANTVDQ